MTSQTKEFNKFQALIWPIHKFELKKFLPMSFLMFFILSIYTLVRDLKDIFVMAKTHMWEGASTVDNAKLLSALKIWFVFPCAFLAVAIFTALMNKHGAKKTFYIIVSAFMVFFGIFGFILYPNLESIMMSSEQITNMVNSCPRFLETFLTCLGNWPITLFYIFAEIWGTMAIASLFWQFANATTMKHEVKRFFGLFSLIGNVGVIIVGIVVKKFVKGAPVPVVMWLMVAVIIAGALVLAIYTYINKVVLTDPRFYDPNQIKVKKKKKAKVGMGEGIKILFKNPYLLLISVLVIAYGLGINLVEVYVKAQGKDYYGKEQYSSMQANISILTGIFTIFVTLFGANIIRRFSWKVGALLTPILFVVSGGLFFAVTMYNQFINPVLFGTSAILIAVWFGVIADAITKSVKYSLFDTTKNMAYLPLDEDTKTKGQAAVEVIGGRAGKAGGALIQQIIYGMGISIYGGLGAVVTIVAITAFGWIFSVCKLSPKYEKAVDEMNALQEEAQKEAAATK